jgi:hypothetical protein
MPKPEITPGGARSQFHIEVTGFSTQKSIGNKNRDVLDNWSRDRTDPYYACCGSACPPCK